MKKLILALAVAAVATMALVSSASADVPRYQMQSMTITAVQPKDAYGQWDDVWTHTYNVTLNPCDGSFTGTGQAVGTGYSGIYTNETIAGHFDGTTLSYKATYLGPDATGVKYALDGPISDTLDATAWTADGTVIDTSPNALEFKLNATTKNTSSYKNHGQYVKEHGGGDDAAHSCLGMPITTAPFEWSTTGNIDSSVMAGETTVALPKAGNYRIDVGGTYINSNLNVADAEYTSVDSSWATQLQGYNTSPWFLGEGFGDVQVNGQFVDWGTYSTAHAYTKAMTLPGGTVNLSVFDGDSDTAPYTKEAGWYGDNSGSLSYAITYVGP